MRGFVCLCRVDDDDHLLISLRHGRYQQIMTDTSDAVHCHRQHVRRQARTEARHHLDHLRAVRFIRQQQARCLATGLEIMVQHGRDLLAEHVGSRHHRLRCTGRADRAAIAASAADRRVDRNRVARRGDGAGRAHIKAARTSVQAVARMRAQVGIVIDIDRLLEIADHLRRLGREAFQPQAVFGIGTEVTVALFPAGEKRGAAGDVDDQVTTCFDIVPRLVKRHKTAARGAGRGKAVDHKVKGGEMA